MVALKETNDSGANFQNMMRRAVEEEGLDINTPYPLIDYLRDLTAIAQPAEKQPAIKTVVWRDPETEHTHVASTPPDHLCMRTYDFLMDRYGIRIGGGRGLRACAIFAFFTRCQTRLDAQGLNWLDRKQDNLDHKFTFLKFILEYPVPLDKQFSPEAIPTTVIDEFLAGKNTAP